jgi:predicted transcriptional regulator
MLDLTITEHTTTIAAAYLGNNTVTADQIPSVIMSVHSVLSQLMQQPIRPAEPARKPAVSVRKSIEPNTITCLDCGWSGQTLKRHLTTAHDLNPEQYRTRWNLADEYPMVAPSYAAKRSQLAKDIGLGVAHRGGSAGLEATTRRIRR